MGFVVDFEMSASAINSGAKLFEVINDELSFRLESEFMKLFTLIAGH